MNVPADTEDNRARYLHNSQRPALWLNFNFTVYNGIR